MGVFDEGVVEAVVEEGVGDHGWDADAEACGGGDEGFADVSCEEFGAAHAAGGHRLKGSDHSADGAEESYHRGGGGDDVEVVYPLTDCVVLEFEGFGDAGVEGVGVGGIGFVFCESVGEGTAEEAGILLGGHGGFVEFFGGAEVDDAAGEGFASEVAVSGFFEAVNDEADECE